MRVQCTECGAQGNVRSEDPNQLFKCPKCGGAMRAIPSGPARRPSDSVAARSRIADRRRRRRRVPVFAVVLGVFVLLIGAVGGYYVYMLGRQPGPGAKALGLLPSSTLAAASVEKFDQLEPELSQFSGASPLKLRGLMSRYRKDLEVFLSEALGISLAKASNVLRTVTAMGIGLVPVKDSAPSQVLLLVLKDTSALAGLLNKDIPRAGDVGSVRIYRGDMFLAVLDNTAALCRRREPIEAMAESHAGRGAKSLERNQAFLKVRSKYCRKGRAWFYVSGAITKQFEQLVRQAGGLAAPAGTAFGLAPSVKHVAGFLKLDDPSLVIRADVTLPDDRSYYNQIRLAPRRLMTPEFMPADAQFAVALALDDPPQTYSGAVEALNPHFKRLFDNKLSTIIRGFERRGGDRISIEQEVMPLLAGELGFFVSMGKPPVGALVVPVEDPKAAQPVVQRLVKKVTGSEPKLSTKGGLRAWVTTRGMPIAFGFVENALVVSMGPQGLAAVKKAHESEQALANEAAFRKAMSGLPTKSTLLFAAREGAEQQRRRHASEAAVAAVSISMEKAKVSFATSLPNLAQALMAWAPSRAGASQTSSTQDPSSPQEIERQSRKNIQELAALCKRFMQEKGKGVHYPRSFADLITTPGYFTRKNLHLLVRPGDKHPVSRLVDMPRTSYEMAFDAVKAHRFTADTPGELPMMWEIAAAHRGKRFVVHFDGTVKLERTKVTDLIKRLKAGLPADNK